jgi:O-methyltransferase
VAIRPLAKVSAAAGASPRDRLLRLILRNQLTLAAMRAAVEMTLADRIGEGTRSADELASELHADPGGLYRLLRALTVLEIVEELPGRAFRLLPSGQFLCSDRPDSVAPMVRFLLQPYRARAMEALDRGILSGRVPIEMNHGVPHFDYLAQHPDDAAIFNAAMTSSSVEGANLILQAYDFSSLRTIADIGGGHGMLLASILSAYPQVRGILYDLPHVVRDAPAILRAKGVEDRCKVASGSFFVGVPGGADLYLMRHILHDWNDDRATQILGQLRAVVPKQGKVLSVDWLVPDGTGPDEIKLLDLNMLVMLGGRERTEAEMAEVYRRSGFHLSRVVPLTDGRALFEGVPV